jgi:hypothetical protein
MIKALLSSRSDNPVVLGDFIDLKRDKVSCGKEVPVASRRVEAHVSPTSPPLVSVAESFVFIFDKNSLWNGLNIPKGG